MPLQTAVERVPDVRRGDTVKIRVISGDLKLLTLGIAQENGLTGSKVRVVSRTTNQELVGQLKQDGVVEVKL